MMHLFTWTFWCEYVLVCITSPFSCLKDLPPPPKKKKKKKREREREKQLSHRLHNYPHFPVTSPLPSCDATALLPINKDFYKYVRSPGGQFLRAQSTWRLERKNRKQWSCLSLPLPCVYNAVDNGLAAAECTLWEWTCREKTARVKCSLKERSELSCHSSLL